MRKSVLVMAAMALVMAMAGVSSASAAQWSPQNTNVLGVSAGTVKLRAIGVEAVCTSVQMKGKTTGSAIAGSGATAFLPSNCSTSAGPLVVTSAGNWSVNALSTTTASLSGDTSPSGGTLLTLEWPSMGCTATVKGPINATGLQWSNATHQLTLPKGTSVPVSGKGLCAGFFGTSLEVEGKFSYPTLTVTP
jgi:hypothetical protein